MPLMIVVLDFATRAQPGHDNFWSTAAEGQAARMPLDHCEVNMLPRTFLNRRMRHWSFA